MPSSGEQVAHAVGVAADAVVGARLVRQPVAEQVGRDHGVAAGQRVDDRLPRGVVAAEPVQEQQRRPLADLDEGPSVAVDGDELDLVPSLVLDLSHGSLPMKLEQRPGPVARVVLQDSTECRWVNQGLFITCWLAISLSLTRSEGPGHLG